MILEFALAVLVAAILLAFGYWLGRASLTPILKSYDDSKKALEENATLADQVKVATTAVQEMQEILMSLDQNTGTLYTLLNRQTTGDPRPSQPILRPQSASSVAWGSRAGIDSPPSPPEGRSNLPASELAEPM